MKFKNKQNKNESEQTKKIENEIKTKSVIFWFGTFGLTQIKTIIANAN